MKCGMWDLKDVGNDFRPGRSQINSKKKGIPGKFKNYPIFLKSYTLGVKTINS
jgi:hypothetical protein